MTFPSILSATSATVVSTFALLALAGCGGSTSNNNPGDTGDSGTAAQDSGTGGHDAAMAGDSATTMDGTASEAGPPSGVVAVPLYSCVPTVYTAQATIGTQQFQMLIDTGSTTLGVAAAGCSCGGVSPTYTPGSTAVDQKQMANSQYGSGSWTGEIYQDDVVLGTSAPTPTKLVAINSQSNFFNTIMCDSTSGGMQGILGLGPAGAALQGTTGFFDALVGAHGVPDVFATKLCDTGGTLWLGGFDPSAMTAMPQYTPSNDLYSMYYHTVNLASITVGTTTVPVASGNYNDSVVDTGTSVFLIGTPAYNAIVAALEADAQFQSLLGAGFFPAANSQQPTCKSLSMSKAALDAALPPLTMTFGAAPAVTAKAVATESYLFQYGGQWCSAMVGIDQGAQTFPFASIMGAPVMRSNVIVFDVANKRIGFAPHTPCP